MNKPPADPHTVPTEPGIYWCRKSGGAWFTATLVITGLVQPSTGCSLLVLPDNRNFDVRDYVTNWVAEGWEFRQAKPPADL